MINLRALFAGAALVGGLTLAACSGSGDPSPGTTSADEDRQLNEAAAMLEANSVDLNAIAPTDPTNESAAP